MRKLLAILACLLGVLMLGAFISEVTTPSAPAPKVCAVQQVHAQYRHIRRQTIELRQRAVERAVDHITSNPQLVRLAADEYRSNVARVDSLYADRLAAAAYADSILGCKAGK